MHVSHLKYTVIFTISILFVLLFCSIPSFAYADGLGGSNVVGASGGSPANGAETHWYLGKWPADDNGLKSMWEQTVVKTNAEHGSPTGHVPALNEMESNDSAGNPNITLKILHDALSDAKTQCASLGNCTNPKIYAFGFNFSTPNYWPSHLNSWGMNTMPSNMSSPSSWKDGLTISTHLNVKKVVKQVNGTNLELNSIYNISRQFTGNNNKSVAVLVVVSDEMIQQKGWMPEFAVDNQVDVLSTAALQSEQLTPCPVEYVVNAQGIDGYVYGQTVEPQKYLTPFGKLYNVVATGNGTWASADGTKYGPFTTDKMSNADMVKKLKEANIKACNESYDMSITYDINGKKVETNISSIPNKDDNSDGSIDGGDFLYRYSKGGLYKVIKQEKLASITVTKPGHAYYKRPVQRLYVKGWKECKKGDTASLQSLTTGTISYKFGNTSADKVSIKCVINLKSKPKNNDIDALQKSGLPDRNGNTNSTLVGTSWNLTGDNEKAAGVYILDKGNESKWEYVETGDSSDKLPGAVKNGSNPKKLGNKTIASLYKLKNIYPTQYTCNWKDSNIANHIVIDASKAMETANAKKVASGTCIPAVKVGNKWVLRNGSANRTGLSGNEIIVAQSNLGGISWKTVDGVKWTYDKWVNNYQSGESTSVNNMSKPVANNLQSFHTIMVQDFMHVNCNKNDLDKYIDKVRAKYGENVIQSVTSEKLSGEIVSKPQYPDAAGNVIEPFGRALTVLGDGNAATGYTVSNPGSTGFSAIDYTTNYYNTSNGTIRDPFYTKECPFDCVDTSTTTSGNAINNVRDANVDGNAKADRNYGVKVRAADEKGNLPSDSTNTAIMTFFKNNAKNAFTVDVWHPVETQGSVTWNGSKAISTTILSNVDATGKNDSDDVTRNGTPWVINNKVLTNMSAGSKQLFNVSTDNVGTNLSRLTAANNVGAHQMTLSGQVNEFTIKSPWASEAGKPLRFNIKWEYEANNKVMVPARFTIKANGLHVNHTADTVNYDTVAIDAKVDGQCYSNALNTGETNTQTAFHDNTGYGSKNDLDTGYHDGGSEKYPFGHFEVNFVRATAE